MNGSNSFSLSSFFKEIVSSIRGGPSFTICPAWSMCFRPVKKSDINILFAIFLPFDRRDEDTENS